MCLTLRDPMHCSPWNSPGQNAGGGSLSFLQGNLPNPGIKPMSPALQVDSLPAEPQGKSRNIGVGSVSLLQGIFPTQELNQGLLHCRQILYQLSYHLVPPCKNILNVDKGTELFYPQQWEQRVSALPWQNGHTSFLHTLKCTEFLVRPSTPWGFPHSSIGKESACSAGDPGLIPGSGKSPGEGNGKPLQYSCLENPMDRGA